MTAALDIDAPIGAGKQVLHNMSARPRTPVTTKVVPLRSRWASFTLASVPDLDEAACRRLDTSWRRLGFTGAALVHPWSDDLARTVEVFDSADTDLITNVVLRTRGSLLLAQMPLIEYADGLVGRTLVTPDPRLVAIVADQEEVQP
jgi:hypothetical protein